MKPYLNNIKEFINFFIEQIHMEVNRVPMKNIIGNNLDKANKQLAFQEFINYFGDNYRSIISDLFYGVNCKSIECIFCKTSFYAYKIYSFLIFPLEQVRYFVQEKSINLFQSIDIYQCFEYDKRLIKMEYYCNKCNTKNDDIRLTSLVIGPEILIIIIQEQNNISFQFYEVLQLQNYIEVSKTGYQYQLIGVIAQIGNNFISYCREFWNNTWFKFNDSIVEPVNNSNEVFYPEIPHVLFYRRVNNY